MNQCREDGWSEAEGHSAGRKTPRLLRRGRTGRHHPHTPKVSSATCESDRRVMSAEVARRTSAHRAARGYPVLRGQ